MIIWCVHFWCKFHGTKCCSTVLITSWFLWWLLLFFLLPKLQPRHCKLNRYFTESWLLLLPKMATELSTTKLLLSSKQIYSTAGNWCAQTAVKLHNKYLCIFFLNMQSDEYNRTFYDCFQVACIWIWLIDLDLNVAENWSYIYAASPNVVIHKVENRCSMKMKDRHCELNGLVSIK